MYTPLVYTVSDIRKNQSSDQGSLFLATFWSNFWRMFFKIDTSADYSWSNTELFVQ